MLHFNSVPCFTITLSFCALCSLLASASAQRQSQRTVLDVNLVGDGDGELDDGEGEAFALQPTDDAGLSALLTTTFQKELLPNLRVGIPELGVRPIDPITMPDFTLNNIKLGFFRCDSFVRNLVVYGLANVSNSNIVIDTGGKKLNTQFRFPRVRGKSTGCSTTCTIFGYNLWKPRENGLFEFQVEGMEFAGIFKLRPSRSEIVLLETVDVDIEKFAGRGDGTVPARIEAATNWLINRFGLVFFRYLMRVGLTETVVEVFARFMDQNAWQAVLGDFV